MTAQWQMKYTWKQTYSLHCRDHCAECEKRFQTLRYMLVYVIHSFSASTFLKFTDYFFGLLKLQDDRFTLIFTKVKFWTQPAAKQSRGRLGSELVSCYEYINIKTISFKLTSLTISTNYNILWSGNGKTNSLGLCSQDKSETYLASSSVPVETTLLPYPTLMPLEVTSTIVDKILYALTVV